MRTLENTPNNNIYTIYQLVLNNKNCQICLNLRQKALNYEKFKRNKKYLFSVFLIFESNLCVLIKFIKKKTKN